MPYIHVTLASGRTPEAKRALMSGITQAVHEAIGVAPETIRVWITEIDPQSMSTAGVPLDEIRRLRAEGKTNL